MVSVSKQDSDTRYVRREKGTKPGDASRKFANALNRCAAAVAEFTELAEPGLRKEILSASILDQPAARPFDLMVCSPPYPNAYSYHLYHRTRMLWLGMDQPRFKREEIGSHRKYSSKSRNGADAGTFAREMSLVFGWLRRYLKAEGHACFVIGNSTIGGQTVDNASLISGVALAHGFKEVARIKRTISSVKKSFNPSIGRIKSERILVLRRLPSLEGRAA